MNDTTTWTVTIDKNPDEIWTILSDVTKHADWSPTAFHAEKVSDGPIGVGTVYKTAGWLPGQGKDWENEVTITKFEPGKELKFDSKDPRGPVIPSDFVLTAEGSSTRVDRTMTMPKPNGFQGVLWPVIFPMLVKPAIQKNLVRFKTLVETGKPE